jgi:hypothetical protein
MTIQVDWHPHAYPIVTMRFPERWDSNALRLAAVRAGQLMHACDRPVYGLTLFPRGITLPPGILEAIMEMDTSVPPNLVRQFVVGDWHTLALMWPLLCRTAPHAMERVRVVQCEAQALASIAQAYRPFVERSTGPG